MVVNSTTLQYFNMDGKNCRSTKVGSVMNKLIDDMIEIERKRGRDKTPRVIALELIAKRIYNKGGLEK